MGMNLIRRRHLVVFGACLFGASWLLSCSADQGGLVPDQAVAVAPTSPTTTGKVRFYPEVEVESTPTPTPTPVQAMLPPSPPGGGIVLTQEDIRPLEVKSVKRAEAELIPWAARLCARTPEQRDTIDYAEDHLHFLLKYRYAAGLSMWETEHDPGSMTLPPWPSPRAQEELRTKWEIEAKERERKLEEEKERQRQAAAELARRQAEQAQLALTAAQLEEARRANAELQQRLAAMQWTINSMATDLNIERAIMQDAQVRLGLDPNPPLR